MVYFLIFVGVCLFLWIIGKIYNIKKLKKARLAQEQRAREEQEKMEALKLKFKENAIVKGWAKESAANIAECIGRVPHRKHSIHFKSYQQDMVYGYNLQDIWLPNIREFIKDDNCSVIDSYNFLQYDLPNLSGDIEMNIFAEAFCELVSATLNEENGISTSINKVRRYVDNKGYIVEGWENKYIYVLNYYPPQASGQW